ncbi:MAG: FAD-binding protein, partial [Chloroflexota bacterium]|nr:FAD-binding protein [Chloroflexota bacterium]
MVMNWIEETEVLIIGFGGAGATAAITAHDLGANVLILEKMQEGGGNTNASFGGLLNVNDIEQGHQYFESLCNRISQLVEPEMTREFTLECSQNKEWIESLGATTVVYGGASFPELPGSGSIQKLLAISNHPEGENSFWHLLSTQVERRQIPVWYNSPADRLITDTQGMVIGAIVIRDGKEAAIKAKRATILTCGGFEFNDWMKMNYLKGYPYHAFGSPGNRGDGLSMAQRVGADLWHTSSVSAPLGFKAPDFEAAFMIRPPGMHYIYVDKRGKRFASELAEVHAYNFTVDYFDPHSLDYPRIPCFMIFDSKGCGLGPIGITALGFNRGKYEWSNDNTEEI